jgi:hypothetical protein
MKNLVVFILSFTLATSIAQTVTDVTETNCDNQTESVSQAISGGQPLIVVASGYDCWICQQEADDFDLMADTLVGKARVWGALHYKYNSGDPGCGVMEDWMNDYGWDNMFAFVDVNNGTSKSWANGGYPSYTVIGVDQTYLYKGTNKTNALNTLFEAMENTISSIAEESADFVLKGLSGQLGIEIIFSEPQSGVLTVYDLTGSILHQKSIKSKPSELIELEQSGLVLVNFTSSSGSNTTHKLLLN